MTKTASLFVAAGLLFPLEGAKACSCAPPPPTAVALNGADAVFSGKVVDISPSGEFEKTVTFDVDKTWKGNTHSVTVVSTSADGAMCGNSFDVGESWLVYAYGKSELSSSSCSRTTPLEYAHEDLKALGPGQIAPPAPPRQSKTIWIALILAVGVIAAGVSMKFKRLPTQFATFLREQEPKK